MCATRGSTHARRRGRRRHFGRFGDRADWLDRLEQHQRDLEQELADVADLIRRLKEDRPPASASV